MTEHLPQEFLNRMKTLLGDAYDAFLGSFASPPGRGLRVNPQKIADADFCAAFPTPLTPVPWVEHGYYYGDRSAWSGGNETCELQTARVPENTGGKGDEQIGKQTDACRLAARPAQHPWYSAGLFYIQEPSAMTPADRLPVEPGDRVLDLCAAPGGKATQLAGKLGGEGLLVANEVSNARAKALLRNLEQTGARNIVVTNESAERLAQAMPETFDKIMLDAPCSGEGMFRRRPEVAADWSPEKVRRLAKLQRQLIDEAVKMLRPGGLLMYSTCTFSPEEDEGTVLYALTAHPELSLAPIRPYEGFAPGRPDWVPEEETQALQAVSAEEAAAIRGQLEKCVRIWPHKMAGEGHFMALFKKCGEREATANIHRDGYDELRNNSSDPDRVSCRSGESEGGRRREKKKRKAEQARRGHQKGRRAGGDRPDPAQQAQLEQFLRETQVQLPKGNVEWRGGRAYLMPVASDVDEQSIFEGLRGLHFLRSGLYLGESRPGRFVPSEPFALALHSEDCGATLHIPPDGPRLQRYLRGESIPVRDADGWKLLCAGAHPIAWGKVTNGILKNHLPAGWRRRD